MIAKESTQTPPILALMVIALVVLAAGKSAADDQLVAGDPATSVFSHLIGDWDVTEDIAAGVMGPASAGRGKARARWGPGRHSVIIEYESVAGPMTGFRLTEMIAKEPGESAFSLAWVDSFSPGIKSKVGKALDDDTLEFTSTEMRQGVAVTSVSLIETSDKGFVITTRVKTGDDEPRRFMTLTYSRPK